MHEHIIHVHVHVIIHVIIHVHVYVHVHVHVSYVHVYVITFYFYNILYLYIHEFRHNLTIYNNIIVTQFGKCLCSNTRYSAILYRKQIKFGI